MAAFASLMPALSPRPSTCVWHGGTAFALSTMGRSKGGGQEGAERLPQKRRESSAPRPSSPPSSCRKFPSCLRANLTLSRLRKRGEYRAAMSPTKESETALQKGHTGPRDRTKKQAPNRGD